MEKQEILNEYEAAMFAANESGYAGMTAEQVIRSLIERAEAAEEWVKTAERTMDYQAGVITELGIRAEAAEAKLAELEKQQAVGTARMELTIGKEGLRYYQCFVDMRPDLVVAELNTGMDLFTRAAPAINLAELVPGDYFGELVLKARASANKAMLKFPQPNYVLLKVAEEAGEVVQAGVHYAENRMTWQEVEGEIVQLLAMLIRLVTEGDQVNGITPPESCRAAILRNIEGAK